MFSLRALGCSQRTGHPTAHVQNAPAVTLQRVAYPAEQTAPAVEATVDGASFHFFLIRMLKPLRTA